MAQAPTPSSAPGLVMPSASVLNGPLMSAMNNPLAGASGGMVDDAAAAGASAAPDDGSGDAMAAPVGGVPDDYLSKYSGRLADAFSRIEKDQSTLDNLQPPNPYQPTPPPNAQPTDPKKVWGSAAMFFAGLGSLLTRSHATTALNAAGAVMTAYKQNDAAAAQKAFETWKAANANMLEVNKFQLEKYKEAILRAGTDQRQAVSEITALNATFKNAVGQQVLQTQGLQGFIQYNEAMRTHTMSLADASQKVATQAMELQLQHDYAAANPEPPKNTKEHYAWQLGMLQAARAGTTKGGSNDTVGLSDDAVKQNAWIYLRTGKMPNLGMGGKADREAVANEATALAKQYKISIGNLLAYQAALKSNSSALTNATKMASNSNAYMRTALDNMQLIKDRLPDAPKNPNDPSAIPVNGLGQSPWINHWVQTGEEAAGDPSIPAYGAAVMTFLNEYTKVMAGTTSSSVAASDTARREAQTMLNKAMNKESTLGVLAAMALEMKNRTDENNKQLQILRDAIGSDTQSMEDAAQSSVEGEDNSQIPAMAPASAAAPERGRTGPIDISTPEGRKQALDTARALVAKNPAARDQVIQRLQAAGIDPSGL